MEQLATHDTHTLSMLQRRLLHETDPDVLAAIGLALVEHITTCPICRTEWVIRNETPQLTFFGKLS